MQFSLKCETVTVLGTGVSFRTPLPLSIQVKMFDVVNVRALCRPIFRAAFFCRSVLDQFAYLAWAGLPRHVLADEVE